MNYPDQPVSAQVIRERLDPGRVFAFLGAISLLLLVILIPPFQVPDEPQHFFRSYQLSRLEMLSRRVDGAAGAELPASLPDLVEHFMGSNVLHTRRALPIQRLADTFGELGRPLEPERTIFVDFSGAAFYSPLVYIPQAVAIALGRRIEVGPLGLLYMGRLANVLASLLITWCAISLFPSGRTFALLIALLPMTQFMMASVSPDASIIASAFLFTSVLARYLTDGIWSRWRQIVAFASGLAMCAVKIVYCPLLFAGLGALVGPGGFSDARVRSIAMRQVVAAILSMALIASWFWFIPGGGSLVGKVSTQLDS